MESDDDNPRPKKVSRIRETELVKGLYLETVDRAMLDFDFERLCSVTLKNMNVYGCLTCGKYFQGRGPQSEAYYHSMNDDHHVFINLETLRAYILPDGYEVFDSSLNDIKHVIQPVFSKQEVEDLDKELKYAKDLHGKKYLPGFVGLNNMKQNDYVNALVQALNHVRPLRDHFLLEEPNRSNSELVKRFGALIRKMWNLKAFKGHVSPHQLVQEISRASGKLFSIGKQADPIAFLSWFLNSVHMGLGGTRKSNSSLIYKTFQGQLLVETQSVISIGRSEGTERLSETGYSKSLTPFLYLTLEPPTAPLFAEDEKNTIPQIPLSDLLCRFDGKSSFESGSAIKRFSIAKLPEYLIFCIKRFSKNDFTSEKNPTIVNFPVKNMDMSDYVSEENTDPCRKYDLIANITYQGTEEILEGVFKVDVLHPAADQWFQIQDLFVDQVMAQMLILSESYIQIWKMQA